MARQRRGRIFTRKPGGCYYVQFYADGKQIVRALHDLKGNPITQERDARKAADVMIKPYALADRAETAQAAYNALRTAEQAAADAEREAAAVQAAEEARKAAAQLARETEEAHLNRLAIADAWQTYLASVNRSQAGESTLRQYAFQWQAFARWLAEHRPEAVAVADVTPGDAEDYIGALAAGKTAGTVNKHRALLELVFRVLGEKEALPHGNPFARIKARRDVQHHREELRPETLWKVFEAAEGEWKRLLFVGLYTGQRLADCALLDWSQVDLRTGWIEFRPRKTRRADTAVSVPLVAHLRAELERTPSEARHGEVMPSVANAYRANRDRVTDRIQALFRRCGIEVYESGTGPGTGKRAVLRYGFHSLRHSTATILQEAGAPAAVAEAILGHRSTAMRARYTHVGRKALQDAMHRLPAIEAPEKARQALPAPEEPDRAALVRTAQKLLKTASVSALQAAVAVLKG